MSLTESYQKLNDGINFVNELIEDANTNLNERPETRAFIIESAFLKMFIYWESFLEETFIKYISNTTQITHPLPKKYLQPIDEFHAQKMLIGTQKYVDWANAEVVKRLSNLYFENGAPFNSTLASIQDTLVDLKIIRNNTAHVSSTTLSSYLKVIRKRLPNWTGDQMKVSDFLMTNDPSDASITILQAYQKELLVAGYIIKNCEGY